MSEDNHIITIPCIICGNTYCECSERRFTAACHAMQALISRAGFHHGEAKCDLATQAVGYADALLKELEK